MATDALTDVGEAPLPGDVIPLDPNEIELGNRLRPIDSVWAEAIGLSMQREGQIHPVDVRLSSKGGWELAGAGGHRLVGARMASIAVDARIVLFGLDVARRREAAENLFRRSNDPIERADAIAELVRLHREKAGLEEAKHRALSVPKALSKAIREEAGGTCDTMSQVYGWGADVAAELGFSKRTIQRDLILYRGLRPSVVQLLRKYRHSVLKNASQLRQLARITGDEQERIAVRLIDLGNGAAKSVTHAIRLERGSNSASQTAEDRRLSTFIGTFARMTLTEKKGALAQLAEMLPADWRFARREPPQEKYHIELIDALAATFELLRALEEGEPVHDPDISAARGKIQLSLIAANAGAIPVSIKGGEV